MSDLFLNKLAFCALSTGLLMTGLNETSRGMFPVDEPPPIFAPYPAYEPPQPIAQLDYHALFAVADAAAGKAVSVRCQQCHHLYADGVAFTGPPLFGVLGRDIASAPGYKYSAGAGSLGSLDGAWTYEKLDHFLERPKAFAPATAMGFYGVHKLEERINLIAYLRTLTSAEPEPLP